MRRVHAHRRLAVFAGPSLPAHDRPALDSVTYLPPAARGDVKRAARAYDAVLLIDGVFHHDLAPSPKECFAALRDARLFGAASMGALRAVECAPYGFTPLGAIAGWYARGVIDGDDEVAVLTHPQTLEALTVPLVNVRYVARLAHHRGLLTVHERDGLIAEARAIFYMDRTWGDVVDLAPASVREAIAVLADTFGDLKRWDARFALRRVLQALERAVARTDAIIAPSTVTIASHQPRRSAPLVLAPSVPKAPGTYDRAVPFEQTLALVPELRRRYGITRVADTTYLDRTSIPTYSALVPNSPDLLGVYNGKGTTREGAIASAVMEATERQIGASVHLPVFRESLRAVNEHIDLTACGLRDDATDLAVDCVLGTELFSGEAIAVPLAMVQCPWFGAKLFDLTSTNGLASGNNLTEAIYHALCELIERHAWTMYHVRCSVVPRFYLGPDASDLGLAPAIVLPTGDDPIDRLVHDIRAAGLVVRALVLQERALPLTVLASVTEPGASPPMAHMGLGCALSPAHALTRALTEAVQSRVVDIQAAREDILRADEPGGIMGTHARRLKLIPTNRWYYDLASDPIALGDLPDRTGSDLAGDLRVTIEALREYGVPGVIAVDLSPPDLPISVVRTIVPGLETYVFSGHMGPRARAELNPFTLHVGNR
jgi:ribosomal protein S12 methylthiotransferase accessory factor